MKKNCRAGKEVIYVVLIMMIIVFICDHVAFAAQPTPLADIKSQVSAVPGSLCSDPSVTLNMTKIWEPITKTAKITLTGTVCNIGLKDYVGTVPMDAFFMVITWHPPKTAAMESDLKVFSHNAIGNTLKKGECKRISQVYTINGVTKWGHTETNSKERQASKEFTFGVDRKYPMQAGDMSFSKAENCHIENDRASVTVDYMESLAKLHVGPLELPNKGIPSKEKHPDWLNPQPEPPLPLDQLNPQPDPPLSK
jgi:hypothetical protein